MIPVYSMEGYGGFVYFGGGGGYEIKNQIIGYRINPDSPILTQMVHEESTDKGIANFMSIPKDVSLGKSSLKSDFFSLLLARDPTF